MKNVKHDGTADVIKVEALMYATSVVDGSKVLPINTSTHYLLNHLRLEKISSFTYKVS